MINRGNARGLGGGGRGGGQVAEERRRRLFIGLGETESPSRAISDVQNGGSSRFMDRTARTDRGLG